MQSQGSQAKDLKPTLLGHGLAEWFREWGQGQGPQAKSPMDSKTCNNPKKTYIGSRWDSYKYIHVYCVYIYIYVNTSSLGGPRRVGHLKLDRSLGDGGWGGGSIRFHFDFTSISLRIHFDFTSISLRAHFDFISISLWFQFDFTSNSFRIHFHLTLISLRIHFDCPSISHWEKGKRPATQGKRENSA
jgi:hypothetical protein